MTRTCAPIRLLYPCSFTTIDNHWIKLPAGYSCFLDIDETVVLADGYRLKIAHDCYEIVKN